VTTLLAYRPFLDPMDLQTVWWWLLIPMAILVSIAWKAVRVANFRAFWRPVAIMSIQIVLAMAGLAIGAHVLADLLVPLFDVPAT
jgi:hypothetical protein